MNPKDTKRILSGLVRIHHVMGDGHVPLQAFQDEKELLIHVCREVASSQDIALIFPDFSLSDGIETVMNLVSLQSRVRIRKIHLSNHWWTRDCGVLLGFYKHSPCKLSPVKGGKYRLSSPVHGDFIIDKSCEALSVDAWAFTKPLPNHSLSAREIFRFVLHPVRKALAATALLQTIMLILMMMLPVTMGYLFDNLNTLSGTGFITQLGIALLVNAVIYTILSLNQALLLLHLRFKVQATLEPAMWDRILKLSSNFFRRYQSGEIAFKASAMGTIQEMLTQSAILSIFSAVLSTLSLILMFYYDPLLAVMALGGFVLSLILLYILNRKLLLHVRVVYKFLSKQAGMVFQSVTGIIKYKVSASEFRAFNQWADYFSNMLHAKIKAGSVHILIHIINESLLLVMTLIIFVTYYFQAHPGSTGDFVAFNAAFTQFFTALLGLSFFISSLIEVIPIFEQSMVIFQSETEPGDAVVRRIELEGDIVIKNLSFRYDESQAPILKNISMHIAPGEAIGITGASGCGKSTLFRLLLGLEKPSSGKILYDGLDMELINLSMLRQQVGVVSQKSTLVPGTILENIIGSDPSLTRKDAWDIIYTLGLEQMLKAFPMEMDTFINEGMQSFSGGEVQRIILARALVKKPKILFLDEATSALDSSNQAKIQDYLRTQRITQLIIAHRLSTLRYTDKIFVLQGGDIIQQGSFDTLVKTPGYFAELARLQFLSPDADAPL